MAEGTLLATVSDHRFKLDKRGQFFIRVHNETLSVVAMGVHNPNSSPLLEADERERPDMSSAARHKN